MSAERYIQSIDVGNPQSIREWASFSLESRKLPDTYSFNILDGQLINPLNGRPVRDAIRVNTFVDRLEMKAFDKIESWACQTDKGISFWLSPPHPERSIQGKIIVSQVKEEQIINRSILFDTNMSGIINIANGLSEEYADTKDIFFDLDQVRAEPILCSKKIALEDWVFTLEQLITEQNQWEMIKTGEDLREVDRTIYVAKMYGKSQSGVSYISTESLIGSNEISCPPGSPSGVFGKNSIEGKFVKKCGKCGAVIQKVIFKGYTCESCSGVYLGC